MNPTFEGEFSAPTGSGLALTAIFATLEIGPYRGPLRIPITGFKMLGMHP